MTFSKDTKRKYTIAFDIDGTLIDKEDKPRTEVIALLKAVARNKQNQVILWSGGGISYAEMWMRRLDIEDYIFAVCTKTAPICTVDIAIDDQDVKLGKFNLKV